MPIRTHDRRPGPGLGFPTVAIVGRPNVGKSTLFNRIVGRRIAIVGEQSGMTRDRQLAEACWRGLSFLLTDTGGVVEEPDQPVEKEIRRQAFVAIEHADLILLVVDGDTGIHAADRYMAELLRRSECPVLLVVNKLDELATATEHFEFYSLGLGDPIPVSALSGKGSGDLLDRVVARLPRPLEEPQVKPLLRLAVIGKPNVGKSSFVNQLLGEERVIVHEAAGTTRDSIDTYLEFEGSTICLIDTAGLRRRSRVVDEIEFYSRVRASGAIRRADICLLLADTAEGVTNQDFHIGQGAWDEGCGLVFMANKWDLIEDRGPEAVSRFEKELKERASFLRWVPFVTASAKTGLRVRKVLEITMQVQQRRCARIPTAEVNRVLRKLVGRRQPPQGGRGEVRLYYASQVATEPPIFGIWSNRPKEVAQHYVRYLERGFREEWDFEGVSIQLKMKQRDSSR